MRRDAVILAAIVLTTVPCWVGYVSYDAGEVAVDSYRQGRQWSQLNQATWEECDERRWTLPRPEVNIVKWMQGCTDQIEVQSRGPAPG